MAVTSAPIAFRDHHGHVAKAANTDDGNLITFLYAPMIQSGNKWSRLRKESDSADFDIHPFRNFKHESLSVATTCVE